MNTITLEIPTRRGRTKTRHFALPASIEEVTAKQWRMIARVVDKFENHIDQKLIILRKLTKIKNPDILQGEHIVAAANLLSFLDDADLIIRKPIITRVGLFRTPRKRLNGFTGWQMALCDTILQSLETKKEVSNDLLADFCAANTTLIGFGWSDFVADHIAIPYFRHFVRRRTKLAILMQYRAMRRVFPELYENAFTSDGGDNKFPSLGWDGTIVRLAGDKFGQPDKVKRTEAHQLFIYLEETKRDEIRQELNAAFSRTKSRT